MHFKVKKNLSYYQHGICYPFNEICMHFKAKKNYASAQYNNNNLERVFLYIIHKIFTRRKYKKGDSILQKDGSTFHHTFAIC